MSPDRTNVPSDQTIVVGVDIGATTIKAGIVNLAGELIESFHQPSPRTPAALRDFVHLVLQQAKTQGKEPPGLLAILNKFRSKDLRRGLVAVNSLLEAWGKDFFSEAHSKPGK